MHLEVEHLQGHVLLDGGALTRVTRSCIHKVIPALTQVLHLPHLYMITGLGFGYHRVNRGILDLHVSLTSRWLGSLQAKGG